MTIYWHDTGSDTLIYMALKEKTEKQQREFCCTEQLPCHFKEKQLCNWLILDGEWKITKVPVTIIGPWIYTECPRRNVPDFGRVFLMLKYTDITQNTYVQSWTVTEIMVREKCGLLARPHTVIRLSIHCYPSWQPVLACGVKILLVSRDKRLHMGLTLVSR